MRINVRGLDVEVHEEILNDWDMLERLADADKGDISALIGFFKALFGDEQWTGIKARLREMWGGLPVDKVLSFATEAMAQIKRDRQTLKN